MEDFERETSLCKSSKDKSDLSWDRILGVSIIGGIATGILYYVYCQLTEQQRDDIKRAVICQGKPMIAKFFTDSDE